MHVALGLSRAKLSVNAGSEEAFKHLLCTSNEGSKSLVPGSIKMQVDMDSCAKTWMLTDVGWRGRCDYQTC